MWTDAARFYPVRFSKPADANKSLTLTILKNNLTHAIDQIQPNLCARVMESLYIGGHFIVKKFLIISHTHFVLFTHKFKVKKRIMKDPTYICIRTFWKWAVNWLDSFTYFAVSWLELWPPELCLNFSVAAIVAVVAVSVTIFKHQQQVIQNC